jgi:hypothetical protein
MIAMELKRGRNTTGRLVQNLRAGFVPPQPVDRTSWYSATAARVSGAIECGKAGNSSQRAEACRPGEVAS